MLTKSKQIIKGIFCSVACRKPAKAVKTFFSPQVIIGSIAVLILGALTFGLIWFFVDQNKKKKRSQLI